MSEGSMYESMTVAEALKCLNEKTFVLPAIQRNFVWTPAQIEQLFDSLMQGYPLGALLFWHIDSQLASALTLYDFPKTFHQKERTRSYKHQASSSKNVGAVLDGQQRLTALNIGLYGSVSLKLPNKWQNLDKSYRRHRLYLDLLWRPSPDEEENDQGHGGGKGFGGAGYRFKFIADDRVAQSGGALWFPVPCIRRLKDRYELPAYLAPYLSTDEERKTALDTISTLRGAVYESTAINYYREKTAGLKRVLNIFIRLNSGGTRLSHSDLLFSMAVSEWHPEDGRAAINNLIEEMNRSEPCKPTLHFSKDFVLKAALMLATDSPVGFALENFTTTNIQAIKDNWSNISKALIKTASLLRGFGLSEDNFRTFNAALPIAFYMYRRILAHKDIEQELGSDDTKRMQIWLVRSLVAPSRVWRDSVDTFLTELRERTKELSPEEFPESVISEIMNDRGKPLNFNKDDIDSLLNIRYGDIRARLLLSQMYPPASPNEQFDVDHIFPTTAFWNEADLAHMPDESERAELRRRAYMLPNLQLLEKSRNKKKSGAFPSQWLRDEFQDLESMVSYCEENDLGGVPDDLTGFDEFWHKRRDRMRGKLVALLGVQSEAPAT